MSAGRPLFLALGIACVGMGYVGLIVPGLPSTVFFIVALWAFQRSSPRFERWLLEHRVFGPILRDWSNGKCMSVRTKVIAILFMWITMGTSIAVLLARHRSPWVPPLIAAIGVCVTWYILTRPVSPSEIPSEA